MTRIDRRSGKISYLVYPEFDDDPHPALLRSIRVNLRMRQIDSNDYAQSANPPVLHRKETFLTADHPLHAKFAQLTAQEEKNDLLDDPSGIGTREGWSRRMAERGFSLKGHRLVRAKPQGFSIHCKRPYNNQCEFSHCIFGSCRPVRETAP